MAAQFAAEDRPFLEHARLDKGVSHALHQRRAAGRGDQIAHRPGAAHVAHDLRPRILLQRVTAQQGGDKIAGNEATAVIDNEEPVPVPVKGKADVRSLLLHPPLQFGAVLRLHGIQTVVGRPTVRLQVQADQLYRQALVHPLEDRPRHAVGRVRNHLERSEFGRIDQPQHLGDEPCAQILLDHLPLPRRNRESVCLDDPAQILNALVAAEQIGHPSHHLEAVVLGRIVGGRHHEAGLFQGGTGVVVLVRADHADVDDIGALISEAAHQSGKELRP